MHVFWSSPQWSCYFASLFFVFLLKNISAEKDVFTHEWAAEILGGEEIAKNIAEKNNFQYLGEILPDVYHLRHKRLVKRSLQRNVEHHNSLTSEPEVRWAEQQKVLRRVKRDYKYISSWQRRKTRDELHFNLTDPKWPSMWYLNRGEDLDMNVQKAWMNGATGKGVVVTILDDGLEKDHPDIIQNYDPNASFDVNGHDNDPMPRYDLMDSNRHGTRCAGEVAAVANNSICAVGVAYEASVGGVRMLDGDVTDAVEARSLSLNSNHIDIYSASWGPDDDGKTVDGPGQLATRAFIEGIKNGRNGKGSIFVWASGNGGRDKDNCNCDGYTNAIWTLSISSVTEKGTVPWYSEACSSTLASTYSSGAYGERQIVTTDLHHKCTDTHSGTSASAPLAAGICALALHANRDLTWRDMQHIVVRTARPAYLEDPDWQTNGVGRKVSHRFGYGLMDANAMVELARNWTTVPPQKECEAHSSSLNKMIPLKSYVTVTLEVTECQVQYLEHVQSKVSLAADERGTIEIFLISPAGTKSTLLAKRPKDRSRTGFHSWPFMTVHMWGESPLGIWKLEIHNNGQFYSAGKATIQDWALLFHGTEIKPGQKTSSFTLLTDNSIEGDVSDHSSTSNEEKAGSNGDKNHIWHKTDQEHQPITSSLSPEYSDKSGASKLSYGCISASHLGNCLACEGSFYLYSGHCTDKCPEHTFIKTAEETEPYFTPTCIECHYSCKDCSGPFDYQCTACWPDAKLFPANKDEMFCHAISVIEAYEKQSSWLKITLAVLFVFSLFIFAITIYLFKHNRRAPSSATPMMTSPTTFNGNQANGVKAKRFPYKPVPIADSVTLINEMKYVESSAEEEL